MDTTKQELGPLKLVWPLAKGVSPGYPSATCAGPLRSPVVEKVCNEEVPVRIQCGAFGAIKLRGCGKEMAVLDALA